MQVKMSQLIKHLLFCDSSKFEKAVNNSFFKIDELQQKQDMDYKQ